MGNQIRRLDLRGQQLSAANIRDLLPRASLDISQAVEQIRPLVDQIKTMGVPPVVAAAVKYDGFDPEPLLVSAEEIEAAVAALDQDLRLAIEESIARVRSVSEATLPNSVSVSLGDGAEVSQRWQPIETVEASALAQKSRPYSA